MINLLSLCNKLLKITKKLGEHEIEDCWKNGDHPKNVDDISFIHSFMVGCPSRLGPPRRL